MPVTSLPPAQDTELSLSVERAYRESLVTDRLGALWSLIMAKCFLAQWAIYQFAIPVSGPLYIWTLTLTMAGVASFFYLQAHRVKLYLLPTHFRVNAAVLGGLVVALGFVAYAHFALGSLSAPLAAALAAVLLGSWSLARELVLGRADGDQLVLHQGDDLNLAGLLREGHEAEVHRVGDDVIVDEVRAAVFDPHVDVRKFLHE